MPISRPISELIAQAHANLYVTGQSLHYWRCLGDPQHAPRWSRAMEPYGLYFAVSRVAFLTTAIVGFHRLYDSNPNSLSFRYIASRISDHGPECAESLARASELIAAADPLARKVAVLRHQVFAHQSARASADHIYEVAGISSDELFDLQSTAESTLNALARAHTSSSYAFNLAGPSEFVNLLEVLARDRSDAN